MGRAPCCDKASVKTGSWSPDEDLLLKSYMEKHGSAGNWIALPQKAGLKRCGKSCRLRWLNYLRPDIKHGGFTEEEDRTICSLYKCIGSRWSVIASHLPGRTDNDVKNHWNTKLRKKLAAEVATSSSSSSNSSNSGGGGKRRIRHSPSPSPPVGAAPTANPENPADVPSSTPGYVGRFGSSEPTPFPAPAVDGVWNWNLGGSEIGYPAPPSQDVTAAPSSLPADCSNSYSSTTTTWSDDEDGWVDALLMDLGLVGAMANGPPQCRLPWPSWQG